MTTTLKSTQIAKQVQKALLDSKIYKDEKEFFEIDQKKILISVLKDRLGISYAKLGKELNLSWFPVYKSCLIAKKKYGVILDKVLKAVK
jgi:hypothetical protein